MIEIIKAIYFFRARVEVYKIKLLPLFNKIKKRKAGDQPNMLNKTIAKEKGNKKLRKSQT